jgi:hypothetical protein
MIKRMEQTEAAASPGQSKTPSPSPPSPVAPPSAPRSHPRVQEVGAASKTAALQVAPEAVKKKYSMDYSRFDQLECSDEDDAAGEAAPMHATPGGPPHDLHKRMPPKFLDAMRFHEEVHRRLEPSCMLTCLYDNLMKCLSLSHVDKSARYHTPLLSLLASGPHTGAGTRQQARGGGKGRAAVRGGVQRGITRGTRRDMGDAARRCSIYCLLY